MKKEEFDKKVEENKRIAGGIIKGALVVFVLFLALVVYANVVKKPTVEVKEKSTQQTVLPSPTLPPVEMHTFSVSNTIVKKVETKYRYFFSIKNDDVKDFSGSITLVLVNSKGTRLAEDTFTTSLLKPKTASVVYLEANTGIEGEYGISKYGYLMQNTNKQGVAKGVGTITTNFEDTSDY